MNRRTDESHFQREQRRARIATAWLATGSATQTARIAGVSRSYVHKVLAADPDLRAEPARRRAADTARVLEWSQAHPGAPIEDAVEALDLPLDVVRQALGHRHVLHEGVRRSVAPTYADERLIDVLRAWHERTGQTSAADYDAVAKGDASMACAGTVVARFGSWSAALDLAGIAHSERRPGGRRREWTDERLRAVLEEHVRDVEEGRVVHGLTRWLNADPGRPSPATVRNRVGTWADILAFVADRG